MKIFMILMLLSMTSMIGIANAETITINAKPIVEEEWLWHTVCTMIVPGYVDRIMMDEKHVDTFALQVATTIYRRTVISNKYRRHFMIGNNIWCTTANRIDIEDNR